MTQKSPKEHLYIHPTNTLIEALNKMDEKDVKLLLVMEGEIFKGLLSIGDIQRYFIKHQSFEVPLVDAMRQDIKVSNVSDSLASIKKIMLEHRTEFMPIIDDNGRLDKILFWEDIFETETRTSPNKLNLPVVVMAGGKGTRLRPITHIIPKPLVPIGERPILQVIMDNFIEDGCSEFHLSVSYKSEMIKSYFDAIEDKKYNINYFKEEKPMGTAGSLSLIKNKIKSTFFVSNCDIIINQDYSEIYKYHQEKGNEMTAVAFIKDMEIPYGTFEVSNKGYLESLVEKPQFTFLVNAGLYILEPHLFNEIPEDEFFHITHLMEKIMDRSGKVGVFPINEGSWLDIGQWKEYQRTLERFGQSITF